MSCTEWCLCSCNISLFRTIGEKEANLNSTKAIKILKIRMVDLRRHLKSPKEYIAAI